MSDDEDWESCTVPTIIPGGTSSLVLPAASTLNGDDEEDLTMLEKPMKIAAPSASQVEAARKKALIEEGKLASKLEITMLENETPEERRIRERRLAEEADARMIANDLGGGGYSPSAGSVTSAVAGVSAIQLKTKKDHETFAMTVANKLSDSTTINSTVFVSELVNRVKGKMTTDGLDALIASLQTVRDSRKKAEVVNNKKSKTQIKKEMKAHSDIFGGAEHEDEYEDKYGGIVDDFM